MDIIVTILLLIMACTILYMNKKKYNPAFVLCLLYGVIMFFESFRLYNMVRSKDSTYLLIFAGVLSFCIGVAVMGRVKLSLGTRLNDNVQYKYSINYKAFIALLAFSIAMSTYPAIKNLTSIANSNLTFSTIREDFGTYYNNRVLNLVFNYVVNPFTSGCLPIAALSLFIGIEKKKTIFILTTVFITMTVVMNAGRGILLYFLAMVYFAYKIETTDVQISPEKAKKKRKYKRILFAILVLSVGGYIAVTKLRGTSANEAILRQIYIYICGCVPHLDYRIDEIRAAGVCLYGTGGCHGIFQFIFTMLENFGIMKYPEFMILSDTWYTNALSYISIGPNISFNAYATLFYNMYLDGGVFAVIIEMLLYGGVARTLYKNVERNPEDTRNKLVLIYILYGICFSFVRFQFTLHSHWIAILMLVLLTRREEGRLIEDHPN
jgi:oligosaccharide repeat unit polymerase